MKAIEHVVSIRVDDLEVRDVISYDVNVSMTDVPATFSLRIPFSLEAWNVCQPDQSIQVLVDGVAIITGFIDDSDYPDDDSHTIDINGRCKIGRLATESAPSIHFEGLGILELFENITDPWFPKATLSNARNRRLVRGRGRKARTVDEPIKINTRVGTAIEPGQTRLSVMDKLLDQAGYLVWSSGDGREIVIGKPNYEQEVQFSFYRADPIAPRGETNVLAMGLKRSTADRYSRIICVGAGKGTEVNFGAAASSRFGEAKNNPDTLDGEGLDFFAPKRLVIVRTVQSNAHAAALAEQEMATRDASGYPITVKCNGHGQDVGQTGRPTIFAPDTLAYVLDERTGTRGIYLIVSCNFRGARDAGRETVLRLVPSGTELRR